MSKKAKDLLQISIIYLIVGLSGYFSWNYFKEQYSIVLAFLIADIVMTIVVFIFSLIKKNSSVYDAYWSVLPFYFVLLWIYIYGSQLSLANWLMFFVISFWSWRLTLNWARSWSDFSHEDWRYVDLANKTKAFYPAVNFLGIHLFPTVMVFGCMLPIFYTLNATPTIPALLYVGVAMSFIGTLLEYFADNELAKFRKRPKPKQEDLLDLGLWGKCRNPNYLGEIMFWLGLAIIGLAFNAPWYAYIGVVALISMFVFISIPMKEKRMEKRRPNSWKAYKKRVSMLIPIFS